MKDLPYGKSRAAENSARNQRIAGYAKGGRVTDEGTNITITIAPPKATEGPMMMPPPPKPPMPPMPPMGGPDAGLGPAPGLGAPPGLGPKPLGMKTGGAVGKASGGGVEEVKGYYPGGPPGSGVSRLRRTHRMARRNQSAD